MCQSIAETGHRVSNDRRHGQKFPNSAWPGTGAIGGANSPSNQRSNLDFMSVAMSKPVGRKLARGTRLVIATHNKGKVVEINALIHPYGLEAVAAGELGLAEPDETGTMFASNARIKSRAAAMASGLPALADDSGICVDALDGAPATFRLAGAASARISRQRWRASSASSSCAAPCSLAAVGAFRLGAIALVSRWRRPHLRGPGIWRGLVAATRPARLRLRSDVRARRLRRNVRGNGAVREGQECRIGHARSKNSSGTASNSGRAHLTMAGWCMIGRWRMAAATCAVTAAAFLSAAAAIAQERPPIVSTQQSPAVLAHYPPVAITLDTPALRPGQ